MEKVILGIDWLCLENPTIDWTSANVFVKTEARANAIQILPSWIGDLATVFSKQKSFRLLTRKPWDHKIDLKPKVSLKRSRAYPLSPQETEALKDYLKENLEKGYIQKSKSPISAPMFFVPKKNGSLHVMSWKILAFLSYYFVQLFPFFFSLLFFFSFYP
jgi:hypothetical protein